MVAKRIGLGKPGAVDIGTARSRRSSPADPPSDEAADQATAAGEVAADPVERPARRSASLVTALRTGGVVSTVPLQETAEHPDNPRDELGDLSELAASISAIGILQPLVVAPAGVFLASHPQHRDRLGDAQYVVLAGHRRRAAAEIAEVDDLPAVVRDDLAGATESAETFLHENLGRRDLAPLEEARGFQLLADLKVPQTTIAKRLGVSQAHVSKRLSLLRLPTRVQDAIRQGDFTVANALVLAGQPTDDREEIFDLAMRRRIPIDHAAREVARHRQAEQQRVKAEARAKREKVPVIEPSEEFGLDTYRHRVREKDEIDKAREAGTLVAAVTDNGLEYYNTKPRRDPYAEAEAREERNRTIAMKARAETGALLVSSPPGAQQLRDELARGVLLGIDYANSLKLAHRWLGGTLGDQVKDPYAWRESLRSPAQITHAAWAMTLANEEVRARYRNGAWTEREKEWIERLQRDAGYTPTDWELKRLDALDALDADYSGGMAGTDTDEE